ncbi:MAG: transketolase C-terminal domain-containing protein, partial [Lutibacter sp.]
FRMRGHEEASGTKYVPKELLESWAKKDPILNYEQFLKELKLIDEDTISKLKTEIKNDINEQLNISFKEAEIEADLNKEINAVYAPFKLQEIKPNFKETSNIRFVDAISEGLKQAMQKFNSLIIMGQDIAEYGGVFKITNDFFKEFGKDRVRNTPICESSIIETAYGLSIQNIKSVVELQFSDFISTGFNPVVNLLAKSFYRWAQKADVVLRMPCGAGVNAGPFHSQTNEAWFLKTPGLKVVYPAFPVDAKGLLASAIEDSNPVLFFEHKALYRSVYQDVPKNYYTIPIGKASVIKKGNLATIISFGMGVHWAIEEQNNHNLDVEIIDLRTLQPLDKECIYNSVKKTGKVLLLQEDSLASGLASEISALISENCFEFLDAPIIRVGSLDTPIPFAKNLEDQYLAKSRLHKSLQKLLKF